MENYYLTHEKSFTRELELALPHYLRFAVEAYGKTFASEVARETVNGFKALYPEIPYIGGDENPLSRNLVLTVPLVAFYQAMKARGKTVEEAARIIYKGTESAYSAFPMSVLVWLEGRRMFIAREMEKTGRMAEISQQRRYPASWVANFVPGDGKTFLYGVDYTECGIVKYLKAHDAAELAPYLCSLDIPMCRVMRVSLVRTQTLAGGDERCNFRFSRWGAHPEMTPDFL